MIDCVFAVTISFDAGVDIGLGLSEATAPGIGGNTARLIRSFCFAVGRAATASGNAGRSVLTLTVFFATTGAAATAPGNAGAVALLAMVPLITTGAPPTSSESDSPLRDFFVAGGVAFAVGTGVSSMLGATVC
jgi:hypothetical protein